MKESDREGNNVNKVKVNQSESERKWKWKKVDLNNFSNLVKEGESERK